MHQFAVGHIARPDLRGVCLEFRGGKHEAHVRGALATKEYGVALPGDKVAQTASRVSPANRVTKQHQRGFFRERRASGAVAFFINQQRMIYLTWTLFHTLLLLSINKRLLV